MSDFDVFTDHSFLSHGGDIYRNHVRLDFSINLNPLPVPDTVKEAAFRGLGRMREYPDPLQRKLTRAIARMESVPETCILCGNGASELIMGIVRAFRPEKALLTAPCYSGYEYALKAAGAETEHHYLDESRGFELGEDYLEKLDEGPDMIFLTDPNNPNGKRIGRELLEEILGRCRQKDVIPVLDECFLPLSSEGGRKGSLCPEKSGALHLRAFTKTFSMPGIRIGYLLCNDPERVRLIRRNLPEWNVSVIAEEAGVEAARVACETDYVRRSSELIRIEREVLVRELSGLGFRVYPGDANYLLFRAEPGLYEDLLEQGILIRKCGNYRGLDERYFRIAVRTPEANAELIRTIKELKR